MRLHVAKKMTKAEKEEERKENKNDNKESRSRRRLWTGWASLRRGD